MKKRKIKAWAVVEGKEILLSPNENSYPLAIYYSRKEAKKECTPPEEVIPVEIREL